MLFKRKEDMDSYIARVDNRSGRVGNFAYCLRRAKDEYRDKGPVRDMGLCMSCLLSQVDLQNYRDGVAHCFLKHELVDLVCSCEYYLYRHDEDEMRRA